MNEKKVREAIERVKNFPGWNRDDLWLGMEDMEELTETILEALEKQLPKKPKQADEQRIRYCTTHVCPGCGKEFTGMVSEYCYHCGQRIEHDD